MIVKVGQLRKVIRRFSLNYNPIEIGDTILVLNVGVPEEFYCHIICNEKILIAWEPVIKHRTEVE